jgi:hypothetical protein
LITVAALLLLAACSSSGSASPAGHVPATPPSTHAATSAPHGPAASPSGSPASAATKRAIGKAYAALFGTTATLKQSLAALQNGSAFRATIVAESKQPAAKGSGAKVTSVSLQGPNVALVHFTVISNGKPILPTTGKAVRTGGTWKVAATTFCSLLGLQGTAPKACNNPSITALPR